MSRSVLALVFLVGCVTDPDVDERATPATAEGIAIRVLDAGQWFRPIGCPSPDPSTCQYEGNFWVDLEIRNDAYHKVAGIVWIDTVREDPTGPWHVASARYEGPRASPFEQWGLDVSTGGISGIEPHPVIRFAAFVEMAGVTTWDNNGGADHVIGQ